MGRISIGDQVPNFTLPNQDGKERKIYQFIGKPLVIYFYPKDNTPGCTREACAFRDEFFRFTEAGATVFGISADTEASHKQFKAKYNLPFDLLSDQGNKVRKLFGVSSDLFGLIPGRVTYIIDNKGIVRHVFNNQLNVEKHVAESLRIIKSF